MVLLLVGVGVVLLGGIGGIVAYLVWKQRVTSLTKTHHLGFNGFNSVDSIDDNPPPTIFLTTPRAATLAVKPGDVCSATAQGQQDKGTKVYPEELVLPSSVCC